MRLFGLNVGTLWPYCLGPLGPERSIEWAKEAGFDGIQALPIKWWSYERIRKWEKYVISCEDAFAYGPLWKALLRQAHLLDYPAPLISDWAMFGQAWIPKFSKVIYVRAATGVKGSLLEIHPDLGVSPEEYQSFYRDGYRFCFDTWHARRKERKGPRSITSWRVLLESLPEDAVSLIHAHTTRPETQLYLDDHLPEVDEMLQFCGQRYKAAPVIVELFPPLKSPAGTLAHLHRFLNRTKLLVDL